MRAEHINGMVQKLAPVLKDAERAKVILQRYWSTRIALVWTVEQVHRAANERKRKLTDREAIQLLHNLQQHHNPQYGLHWEDLWNGIEAEDLGRPMTQAQIKRFVAQDILTVG